MLFVSSASALTLPVAETTNTEAFTLANDAQTADIINFENIDGELLDVTSPINMLDTRAWPGSGGAAQVSDIKIQKAVYIDSLGPQYQGHVGVLVRVTGHGRDYATFDGKSVEYVQRTPFIISGTAYLYRVVIVNQEQKNSWLLDGRQRRSALFSMRDNPVELYEWARSYIGFGKTADELEVKCKYWEKVERYLQTEEATDSS